MGETKRARTRAIPRPTSSRKPVRWLNTEELETWQAFNLLLAKLPAALGAQLQEDSSLSFVEYYVLAGLSDQPDHTIRMSSLAVLANSELSRLSHLIRRLENRGFVRRQADPTDGRYTYAILTDAGLSHLTEAAPAHVETVRHLVFDVLDQEEQRALRSIAEKINAQLGDPC